MTIIIITPCLLGFDVKSQAGPNGFIRHHGIFTATTLIHALWHTDEEFTVVLR